MDMIFSIMTEEKGNQKETVKIGMERLKKYFPKGTTPKQMEDAIIKLLERELQRKRGRTAANLLFSGGKYKVLGEKRQSNKIENRGM